jgi:hypothetical protein
MNKLKLTPQYAGLPQGPQTDRPGDIYENPSNVEYKLELSDEELAKLQADEKARAAARAFDAADAGVAPPPPSSDSPQAAETPLEPPSQIEVWKAQLRQLKAQQQPKGF